MSIGKDLGRFTIAKDKLKGFYHEYIFGGKEVEKAEEEAIESLYRLDDNESRNMFEDDLKALFEENGRGRRFFELRDRHKK